MSISHALCLDDARRCETLLKALLPSVANSSISELGSSIGVHGGPGTIVVALQPDLD